MATFEQRELARSIILTMNAYPEQAAKLGYTPASVDLAHSVLADIFRFNSFKEAIQDCEAQCELGLSEKSLAETVEDLLISRNIVIP